MARADHTPPPSRLTPHETPARTASEQRTWLALLPMASTALYYALPRRLQTYTPIQFVPQLLGYLGLLLWARRNSHISERLGLARTRISQGLRWGIITGLILGCLNVSVILWFVPLLGGDIFFLRETPHARIPAIFMLPWLIILIAVGVELNFRGFLLGRLLAVRAGTSLRTQATIAPALAVWAAALTFAFDPFMVATFKHLHWIALWDGIVWGMIWLRLRNLYAPITAHAVEVMVMYSIIKVILA